MAKAKYDKKAKALYITLMEGGYERKPVVEELVVDKVFIDKTILNQIIGIEILNVDLEVNNGS